MPRNSLIPLAFVALGVCLHAQNAATPQYAAPSPNAKTTPAPRDETRGQAIPGVPIFSGNVILSSGGIPAEPVLIKRLCLNDTINEGYTDARGYFTFRPGMNSQSVLTEASVGSSVGNTAFGIATDPQTLPPGTQTPGTLLSGTGCSLVAEAPGYRSSTLLLPTARATNNDLGTIVLTPVDAAAQDATVSATSLAAPKKAKSAFEKASKELAKESTTNAWKAVADLEQAVALYPDYAVAWTLLGKAKGQMGDLQGARAAYDRAISADPRYLPAYGPLIALTFDRQDWEETSRLAGITLSIDPSDANSRWFRAVAEYQLGRYDTAMALLHEIEADQAAIRTYPQSYHIEGLIRAKRQQLPEAAAAFRSFLELSPDAEASESIRQTLQQWQAAGAI